MTRPAVSVVVPAFNEADNITPFVAEIEAAMKNYDTYEMVFVDGGSTDGTAAILTGLMATRPFLRQIRHTQTCGKSAALRTGVRAARGETVVTLDGDCQNNPIFLPPLLSLVRNGGGRIGLAAGQRVGRQDTGFKKIQSRIANAIRGRLLRDGTRDSVCGLKAFPRELFLALPDYDGLHRFIPALVRREGYDVAYLDVQDRPRAHGVSKYGFFDRLWVGIMDLFGVWWLIRRKKRVPVATEIQSGSAVSVN